MNKQTTLNLYDDEIEMKLATDDTIALQLEDFDIEEMVGVNQDALQTSADLKAIIEDDEFEFETHLVDDSIDGRQTPESLMDEVTMLINGMDTSGDLNVEMMVDGVEENLINVMIDETTPVENKPKFNRNMAVHGFIPIKKIEPVEEKFDNHATESTQDIIANIMKGDEHVMQIDEVSNVVEQPVSKPITQQVDQIAIEEDTSELNVLSQVEATRNVTKEEFTELVGNINIVSDDFVNEISVKEEEVIEEERSIPFGQVNIMVIGIGDSGCTTINTLYELNNKEITTVSMHVSSQMLSSRYADKKILIGENIFSGNGSNGDNESMVQAFEDDAKKVRSSLQGVDMLFLTGDFGTDVGSIGLLEVAKIAKELGILTIGFPKILRRNTDFDTGMLIDTYLPQFKGVVDSTVIIDDNILFPKIAKFNLFEAVMYSDNMLISGIRGIYELITRAGKINLDYADIKTAFANRGDAILGCGTASGEHLVVRAIEDAFKSDVLDLASVKNAQTIIFNISCASKTVTIDNATEATNYIYSMASSGNVKQLFFGYTIDETLGDQVKVTFVAAGTTPTNDTPGAITQNKVPLNVFGNEEKVIQENEKETKVEEKSKPRFFDF